MKRSIRFHRMFSTGLAVTAAALSLVAIAQARPAEPTVPPKIEVADGNRVFLVGHATGVQIYSCTAAGWTFVAPRATLYGDNGEAIVSHFAGPTWQAKDGSMVVGAVDEKLTVDPTAIPWLKLHAASTTEGRLGQTTFIQRIATTGGIAPAASECNAITMGTLSEVPYTADYYFWKHKGRPAG